MNRSSMQALEHDGWADAMPVTLATRLRQQPVVLGMRACEEQCEQVSE
jgi:hypothetical protein